MSNITDNKRNSMKTVTGLSTDNIDDLEKAYLAGYGAALAHVNDMWMEIFLAFGATSVNWNTAANQFLIALGAPYEGLPMNWSWFWDPNGAGGVIGAGVSITLISGGSCDFITGGTCVADGQYQATEFGFAAPADTWLWSIESSVPAGATITAGQGTDTVTVALISTYICCIGTFIPISKITAPLQIVHPLWYRTEVTFIIFKCLLDHLLKLSLVNRRNRLPLLSGPIGLDRS